MSGENLRASPVSGIPAEWDQVKESLRDAIREAVKASAWPIYLFGEQGRGKSCAMAALYRKVSPQPAWIDTQRFVRLIQRARTASDGLVYDYSENGHSEQKLWKKFAEEPALLMVDDLGIRAPSDSVYEIVYELVDRRARKPTIYTSNIAPDKLHTVYDGRVASRVLCGTAIHLTGNDRRMSAVQIIEV